MLTRNTPLKATGKHLSIIGHMAASDMDRHVQDIDIHNGFVNRIIWVCVRRSKYLSDPAPPPEDGMTDCANSLAEGIAYGGGRGLVPFTSEAKEVWDPLYKKYERGHTGVLGAFLGRASSQIRRLATIYAVSEMEPMVGVEHLEAAVALWEYSAASVRYLLRGKLSADPAARVQAALAAAGGGMTQTEISRLFGGNKSKDELQSIMSDLLSLGLATRREVKSESGRRVWKWFTN